MTNFVKRKKNEKLKYKKKYFEWKINKEFLKNQEKKSDINKVANSAKFFSGYILSLWIANRQGSEKEREKVKQCAKIKPYLFVKFDVCDFRKKTVELIHLKREKMMK